MASLVAYDDSGSDISDSDEEQLSQNVVSKEIKNNGIVESENKDSTELFGMLPMPKAKTKIQNVYEEEDDEFLQKKETPSEVPSKPPLPVTKVHGKKTQIFLPSLSCFNDDEDDSKPAPKFKPSSKGTGLLNLLPQPKSALIPEQIKKKLSTSLVPDSVKNKNLANNNKVVPAPQRSTPMKPDKKKTSLPLIKHDSSDESDTESNKKDSDFFSLNEVQEEFLPSNEALSNIDDSTFTSTQSNFNPIIEPSTLEHNIVEENQFVEEPQTSYIESETVANTSLDIDAEALQKLAGSRAMRRGETVQFINIDQKEILPDSREWLVKAMTEDTTKRMSSSKRRGDEPTTQQRRKHQITYLAHQAKANEQELENQWANNRLSKKQTQSKYGF